MFNQFKQHIDNKLSSLGVGQVNLIKSWLDEMKITNYIINDDLTIDVNDNVNLINKNLKQFPDYIQFNKINGWFSCEHNQLISLKGCPKQVKKNFLCDNNQLTSLEYCPEYIIDGDFWCHNNKKQFTFDDIKRFIKQFSAKSQFYM